MNNKYLDIAMEKIIKQEVNAVLDKIRAEIESVIQEETVLVNPEARNGYESVVSKLDPDDVFQIIDKYRAESEVQNERKADKEVFEKADK